MQPLQFFISLSSTFWVLGIFNGRIFFFLFLKNNIFNKIGNSVIAKLQWAFSFFFFKKQKFFVFSYVCLVPESNFILNQS